ncbi:MAG: NADPH:quinone reductase [Rhodospirillaceae bacterium]|jgi:NADPH:quinone reductase|nr:NADPH:quinone reductase [Rhodospirillaceae bacterium]
MKAAFYTELGGTDVLQFGEMATPEPNSGEIRVHLKTSGVNPSDWKARKIGRGGDMAFDVIIPHSDGAGLIDAVGESVDTKLIGTKVWVLNAQYGRAFGTAAEYVVLPQNLVFPVPSGVDFAEAACFGIPFLTSHHALTIDGDISGQTVLIQGGAGGVGHHLIQTAKWMGANVITTVSSDEKAAYAANAGADNVLNYRTDTYIQELLDITDGRGVDRIIEVDLAANGKTYSQILAPGGTAVVYGSAPIAELPSMDFIRRGATLKWFIVYELDDNQRQAGATALEKIIADGALSTTIAKKYPLEETSAAHNMVEKGAHMGNVVIEI